MASRNIEDLTESLQELYWRFSEAMEDAGLEFIVTCTLRSALEQAALWSQGRYPIEFTNHLRSLCSLPPITEPENARKVTWTLNSKHNPDKLGRARAFDIALITKEKRAHWDLKVDVNKNEISDYEEAGRIGEYVGLKWGGRFPTPDRPHFEAL